MTSSYEKKIAVLLETAQLSFVKEKVYEDLRGGKYRYDFYLPQSNRLIEVDGEQHFECIKGFQTQKEFLAGRERDRRKNSYALANSIPLYRVPFWEISNYNTAADIFATSHLVATRWHNDLLWDSYQKNKDNS
jgi:hypothetical protein